MSPTAASAVRVRLAGPCLVALCAALLALGPGAGAAQAERSLLSTHAVNPEKTPSGVIEDACGVAVFAGTVYVSDYYHHTVDLFSIAGNYLSQIPGDSLNGACGLATGPGGALYANYYHQDVRRLLPSSLVFDSGNESTGVAVDQVSGDVYVDDRTYVAVYEPSGAPVLFEGAPLKIGLGTLGDGYGVAVSAGKVYVPDGVDNTVKVYEPAIDPLNPIKVIDGVSLLRPQGFSWLIDSAVTIDPSNGHLLVIDNLQPGFEHPEAAIVEFDAAGKFLGQVSHTIIDGEPSGIAATTGTLYVTTGNEEGANLYTFGPYSEGGGGGSGLAQPLAPAAVATAQLAATASPASAPPRQMGHAKSPKPRRRALKLAVGPARRAPR